METLVSICGTCCSFCPAFRKQNCPGCLKVNRKAKLSCAMYRCALKKKVRSCLLCEEFPCKIQYEKGLVYKHSWLDTLKKSDFSIGRKAIGKSD
jgi:hypothetical protein